ncbi:MAG: DUF4389 domain-containing protein [Alphaproteobacteria bacterium]|nr:DUF4389 domain-containing protein [Alphaproteobacteria bacterium]
MSQSDASYSAPQEEPREVEVKREFPWQRLLLSVGFAFLGWCVFWATIVLAVILWVMMAFNREPQPDLKRIASICAKYVGQCLGYAVLLHDETPFPVGPLPKID